MLPEWRKEMQSRRKLEGIDVSHWEGRIDFFEVRRAGIRIVYIKASEGDRGVDPDFERNYREAQTAGLKIGFYHYLTARTVEEGPGTGETFCRGHPREALRGLSGYGF